MNRFVGKVAILSGATQGIGLAAAKRLGKEGCKVVVSSRKQNNVDEAVDLLRQDGIDASGISANQRIKEDRQKLIKHTCDKFGGVDCVFVSAGVNPHVGNLLTVSQGEFDRTFETNLKSNFQFIQEVAPLMTKSGRGSIVCNSTVVTYGAAQQVADHLLLYGLSKLCLVAMVQHVASECLKKGIRVNCVAPGPIDTTFVQQRIFTSDLCSKATITCEQQYSLERNLIDWLLHHDMLIQLTLFKGLDQSKLKMLADFHGVDIERDPNIRIGTADEIAATVAYLLSDDASYVTGNCIVASGGITLTRSL